MILVFDLDDTLYDEITYVRSGFKKVAHYLSKTHRISTSENNYIELLKLLQQFGRGKVFDFFLQKNHLFNKKNVKKCLSIYRLHHPKISLSKPAKACLKRFKNYPKYLLTDGNKIVQSNKIKALKLDKYFKHMIVTHNYGLKYSKPSTYCFNKILQWESSKSEDLIYIGDNPKKDFVNLKKYGFKTVRVLTGDYKEVKVIQEFEADYKINSLNEFTLNFLKNVSIVNKK